MLLAGAGLLIKSFIKLRAADPGIKPEHVLTAKLSLPIEKYADSDARMRFHQALLERITHLPGVEAAGITSHLAVEEYGTNGNTRIEGKSYPPNQEPLIEYRVVSPGYFRTMGITLLRGRSFDEQDRKDAPPVVIINEAMARAVWGTEDPVGKRIFGNPWATVIGVVSDVKNVGLTAQARPELYLDYAQELSQIRPSVTLVLRSRLEPATLTAAVRREVQALDPAQPLFAVETMQAVLDNVISDRRLNTTMFGVFAALSLLLATVGIDGVMSYTVAQHTHESGIRMALGAQATDILKIVVGRGLFLTVLGVAIGLSASLALTRFIGALLFAVQA